ncbi:MAG: universal stress protein [Terriglobales bacterium]
MKVLIAMDSSPFTAQILDAVRRRAWPDDTVFRLITVLEPSISYENHEQNMHQAEIILDETADNLRKRLPHHKVRSEVMEGCPSDLITATAAEWNTDLIVIGSHGDTGKRTEHVGSVAAAVANHAPCSVEIIKVRRVHSSALPQLSSSAAAN